MRLFALRGASSVHANEAPAILDATDELMRELMGRNELEPHPRSRLSPTRQRHKNHNRSQSDNRDASHAPTLCRPSSNSE